MWQCLFVAQQLRIINNIEFINNSGKSFFLVLAQIYIITVMEIMSGLKTCYMKSGRWIEIKFHNYKFYLDFTNLYKYIYVVILSKTKKNEL